VPEIINDRRIVVNVPASNLASPIAVVAKGVVLEPIFTPMADMVLTMAEVEGTVSMHRRRTEDRRL
jgi:hypothetical protein